MEAHSNSFRSDVLIPRSFHVLPKHNLYSAIPTYPWGYAPRLPPHQPMLKLQIVLNPMYTMMFPKLHSFPPGGRTLWLPFAYPDGQHHASRALELLLRKNRSDLHTNTTIHTGPTAQIANPAKKLTAVGHAQHGHSGQRNAQRNGKA